jgi:hypothetical protein
MMCALGRPIVLEIGFRKVYVSGAPMLYERRV